MAKSTQVDSVIEKETRDQLKNEKTQKKLVRTDYQAIVDKIKKVADAEGSGHTGTYTILAIDNILSGRSKSKDEKDDAKPKKAEESKEPDEGANQKGVLKIEKAW